MLSVKNKKQTPIKMHINTNNDSTVEQYTLMVVDSGKGMGIRWGWGLMLIHELETNAAIACYVHFANEIPSPLLCIYLYVCVYVCV